jgi:CDP-6-deoxy-D-xylo-4-hexulose-3-dehydrase
VEQELRNKVKEAAKEYYQKIYGEKKPFDYIPPSGKLLGEKELLNMIDASLDMWLTAGRFNNEFETKFAKYLGVKYALSTNSGSSANLLALSALTSPKLGDRRLKKGDEVISVAAGFPTTINPIIQQGLIPVFIDCEVFIGKSTGQVYLGSC